MKAVRFAGPGVPLAVEDVPDPEAGPQDVVPVLGAGGPILAVSFLGIGPLGHLGYRKQHLEDVLALIGSGRLDLSASVSGTYALDRADEAVDRLRSKARDPVRLLLGPTA
jgi:threonine dehydrogenase-like Zn-dependent dehydrogenase